MTAKKNFLLKLAMALLPLSSVCVCTFAGPVYLQVRIEDPEYNQDDKNRGPVLIPEVSIEDYTLYFTTPCEGCVLRVVGDGGIVVYTTVIPAGADSMALPSYLSGDYELQIIRGNFCFYGDISL